MTAPTIVRRIHEQDQVSCVSGYCCIRHSSLALPRQRLRSTVNIGVAPDCPYGYYDYAPYNCAPDGYYGPEWFNGGVFIGAGPWFHGSNDFQGNVDNSFDPQHGYSGPMPKVAISPQRSGDPLTNSREMKCAMGAAT